MLALIEGVSVFDLLDEDLKVYDLFRSIEVIILFVFYLNNSGALINNPYILLISYNVHGLNNWANTSYYYLGRIEFKKSSPNLAKSQLCNLMENLLQVF